jgi:hypothetical protein
LVRDGRSASEVWWETAVGDETKWVDYLKLS